ncbi:unnamed protein product [Sphagnum compactum]
MVEARMGLDVGSTRVHGVEIGVALMESVSDSWCLQVALDVGSEIKAGLVHEHRRHGEKWRRRHLCLPACYGLVIIAAVALVTVICIQFLEVATVVESSLSSQLPGNPSRGVVINEPFIEDIVAFHRDVLFLVRFPEEAPIPSKERLACQYGGNQQFVGKALRVEFENGRAAISCQAPPKEFQWGVNSTVIRVDKARKIIQKGMLTPSYQKPLKWTLTEIVYDVLDLTHTDITVFAKGIRNVPEVQEVASAESLKDFYCVFGGFYETPVIAAAQEVFRCKHPPASIASYVSGKKISLKVKGRIIPSLAFYHASKSSQMPAAATGDPLPSSSTQLEKQYKICSCTMIQNGAKFLREWVLYHSHLGVEKFFLYDNNSDDELEEVVATLSSFNVTRQAWPWVKTQEAGFSHCALQAQSQCTWMLYTDIDEFLFPGYKRSSPSILEMLIDETLKKTAENATLGQIQMPCLTFGPTGLTDSPAQGVTQGYTCRLKQPERHKSMVLLDSIPSSLQNAIHHFTLKPAFQTVVSTQAVVNHYKYQAWAEFQSKFRGRAATYVVDWTEDRQLTSKDRAPNLGNKAVKPADWETQFCEVQDYGLRDYTRELFASDANGTYMAWQARDDI